LILTEEPRVKAVLASLTPTSRALDVATGTGRWALYLAERGVSVTGIDESPEMVAVAQQKARAANLPIMFIQGAIEDGLAFPSDCFDLVVCALAPCHMLDLQAAVAECSRVLRPGGHLLITDFHPQAVLNVVVTLNCGFAQRFGTSPIHETPMPDSRPRSRDNKRTGRCKSYPTPLREVDTAHKRSWH